MRLCSFPETGTVMGTGKETQTDTAVGYAALVGLTVHSLTAGVALAAVQGQQATAGVLLIAILAHKGFESFSLASVFGMSELSRTKVIALVVAFSLVTPLGLVLGNEITGLLGEQGISILTALSLIHI